MKPFASILLYLFTLTLLPLQAQRPARPNDAPPPSESSVRNSADYNRAFSQVKDNRKKVAEIVSRLLKEKPSASRDIIRGAIDALRDDPEYVTLLDGLIKSAIAAAPDQLANIVSAAAAASPESARTIVSAAIAITGGAAASQENLTTILNAAIDGAPGHREPIYDAAMDAAPNRIWDPLRFPGHGIDANTAGVSERFPDAPPTDLAGNRPIESEKLFVASPSEITEGQTSTLSWSFGNVTNVTIGPGIGTVDATGSIEVSPTETTTYIITATNSSGEIISQSVTVTVVPRPVITSFTANPAVIPQGNNSALAWIVTGASSVTISPSPGGVSPDNGTVSVSPAQTTTYTITAINEAGSPVTQSVTVTVVPRPVITSFTASPSTITEEGGNSTLSWNVTGATSVSISPGVGAVALSGSTSVSPTETTTYTITATNVVGGVESVATQTVTVTAKLPLKIISFSADPLSISSGKSSTLSWSTTGATILTIDNGVGVVTGSTSKAVSPAATTTYTLTATDDAGGSLTASATVTVVPLPVIATFTATPSIITAGTVSTLSWSTTGATALSIDNGVGVVTGATTKNVNPGTTTTYTLTATNDANDSVTRTVTVTVVPAVVINSFTASPVTITAGSSSTLSWSVTGATSISIDNGIGAVADSTNRVVTPSVDTTYTLTAINAAGQTETRTVEVKVVPPSVIATFAANPATITSGKNSTLSWSTTGATSLSIDNGVGVVTGSTSTVVSPAATTTYTLTATNDAGTTATRTATVTVVPAAVIASFTASPLTITAGGSSTLSWSVTGATSISINNGIGTVLGNSVDVTPGTTTTYTLTAINEAGDPVTQTVVVQVVAPSVISSFLASPATITTGNSSTLTWATTGATNRSIDNAIGSVDESGSRVVTPDATTTYTLTATNDAGTTVTRTATVTVVPLPTIVTFAAIPATITAGSSSTLSWSVTGAVNLSISNGVGDVTGLVSKIVTPGTTTTYTLTATNEAGDSVSAPATVTVVPLPVIATFTATPSIITAGTVSTLSWSTTGATALSIDNGVGVVTGATTKNVNPGTTTTYTLTATNDANDSVTRTVTVTVVPAVVINSFTASPVTITAGSSSTLSWSVTGATSISIDNGIGAVADSTNRVVTPSVDTTYTLTAINAAGQTETRTVEVKVVPPSVIATFAANPATITSGKNSTLSWSTTGATSLSIDNGVGVVTGSTSTVVSPAATTTYTLTATNDAGTTATRTATVTVVPAAVIASFTASPLTITAGGSSTLSWSVTGATSISINNGIGTVLGNSVDVTPGTTTTYTLTAINEAGDPVTQTVVVQVVAPSVISSFLASPATITTGNSSTLTWATTGATNRSIDNAIGSVDESGSRVVTPDATTTYTLTATNDAGTTVTRTATVTVVPLPTIVTFAAIPATITAGNFSNLTWSVTGAKTIIITNGIGIVTGSSVPVVPSSTTTYTLTATNDAGDSVTATATVTVVPAVVIASFTASPTTITAGNNSTLSWSVTGATDLSIDNGVGAVSGSSIQVTPGTTTTYTLTATNDAGDSVTATATVTVVPAALIASFTASPATITVGNNSTLSWSTTGATSLSINNGIGSVTGSTSTVVSPAATTTYTLTATNDADDSVTATATVTVVPAVVIASFTASPTTITAGNNSTLSWSVTGATGLSIDNGVGAVSGSSIQVTPGTTTTYTLTATNDAGDSVTATVTVTVVPPIVIASFAASPEGIFADGVSTSTLSWVVSNADSIVIDNGIGSVSATGSTVVKPATTTEYILTATNTLTGDSLSRRRIVTVVTLPPTVLAFTAAPIVITAGESVELEWLVAGADEISIDQGVGAVAATGSTSVTPEPDTTTTKFVTYTLTAKNGTAIVTEDITIEIRPKLPKVDSFNASPGSITSGGTSTLSWTTSNATSVQIVDDDGNDFTGLAGSGSLPVTPTDDTTYTITASNANGDTDTKTVTVVVNPPLPIILSFTADPHPEFEGVFIISWATSGADTVEITNIGPVPTSGSTLVSPTEDTDYTLTATNSAGSVDSNGGSFPKTRQATRTLRITVRPPANRPPVINAFTASPSTIPSGSSSTLSWNVSNATEVSISPGVGSVSTASGTSTVSPAATITYTLSATNANGSVTRSIQVTVLPPEAPPVINSFTANPSTIVTGQTTGLSWSVTNATSVTITGISGSLNPSSGTATTPALTQTTTYTLEATNASGNTARQAIRVTVVAPLDPPTIASFTATPAAIIAGDSSTLAWSVINADTVSIDQGIGGVSPTDTRIVTPVADTTYTLTATNASGTVTRTVKVSVAPLLPPTIASFTIDQGVITEGESTTLRWETTNANSIFISPSVGSVSGTGTNSVKPLTAGIYSYTLLAINKSGSVSRSVSLRVNAPIAPSILSFAATPASIVSGDSSILSWQVINADTVSISPQPGTVTSTGSTGVSPTSTQTYTITAIKGSLTTTRQVTVTVTAPAQPPVINAFTASPSTIIKGDSTTLLWDIITDPGSPLTSLTITPAVAVGVSNSGSATVSPTANTTYTITATNAAGTVSRTVSVIVDEPDTPPIISSFTASPGSIFAGQTSVLSWNVENADLVTISPNVGTFSTGSGSYSVSPTETTSYTLTAFKQGSNGGLTATRQLIIEVKIIQPKIEFTASPPAIYEGSSSTLNWTVTGADPGTISISPAIGAVGSTGNQSVSPTVTTSYTITASNAGGVSTYTVIIIVVPKSTTLVDPNTNPNSTL